VAIYRVLGPRPGFYSLTPAHITLGTLELVKPVPGDAGQPLADLMLNFNEID
jgi:hypothetical protein